MKHAKNGFISLLCCILITGSACAAVQKNSNSSLFQEGVIRYKSQNYVGCMQSMQQVIKNDPGNAVAHYYLAIAYIQLGKKEQALAEYGNVLALNPTPKLAYYAQKGINQLQPEVVTNTDSTETPATENKNSKNTSSANKPRPQDRKSKADKKSKENNNVEDTKESTVSTEQSKLTPEEQIEQDGLDRVKDILNTNKGKINPEEIEKFQDFSRSKSDNSKPTGEEVANALQVLAKAGITQNQYQNPETMQTAMLMNSMNPSMAMNNGTNTGAMNMMPMYLMMQGQNGNQNIDPQVMQNMITNMMMSGMSSTFNTDNNNNNY